jgi:hypothetical protein
MKKEKQHPVSLEELKRKKNLTEDSRPPSPFSFPRPEVPMPLVPRLALRVASMPLARREARGLRKTF